jgi:hypothetical protein
MLSPLRGARRISRTLASSRFCPTFKPFGALDGWCPLLCGAHALFHVVVSGDPECGAQSQPLAGDRRSQKSLARSGITTPVPTKGQAARCRSEGGLGWFVLDISFPRRCGALDLLRSTEKA